ncbi:MAG: proteasome assembly chaperone family protein [Methanomicrobiales archaeon]|jgi:hypothetical protein|nr:proteasome assembly chaperone family protein [Methanomicrobiales archaeon]
MDAVSVRFFFDKVPRSSIGHPVLIEGLPGVGHVGKLVAGHLIEELGATRIAEVHSVFFPPQVMIGADGVIRLVNNEWWYARSEDHEFLFLVGDYQSMTPDGHFVLADHYIRIARSLGVKRVYTIGGFGVGHNVEEPRVLAAVNRADLRPEVESAGAIFGEGEPGGGIVGAAGLLLAMGASRNIEGICLMGETSGFLVDPRSAASLLKVLSRLIKIPIEGIRLEERGREMERMIGQMIEAEQSAPDEELRYIV